MWSTGFLCKEIIESVLVSTLFLNSSFLTGKFTQIVQFSTAYFTDFVNGNAVDSRRFQGEDTFYTYSSRHFAYSETFLFAVSADFDNDTAVHLNTTIRYATVTVSPALNEGCCLPVANASSAILIKSIVFLKLNCLIVPNATYQVTLLDSDCAEAVQSKRFFMTWQRLCALFCLKSCLHGLFYLPLDGFNQKEYEKNAFI